MRRVLVALLLTSACVPEPVVDDTDTGTDADTEVEFDSDTDIEPDTSALPDDLREVLLNEPEPLYLWGEGWIRGNEHPVHPVHNPTTNQIETPLLWLDAADDAWVGLSDDHAMYVVAQDATGWQWVGDGARLTELSIDGGELLASGAALDAAVRMTLTNEQLVILVVPNDNTVDSDAVVYLDCGPACDGDPGPGTLALPENQFHEAFVAAPSGGAFIGSMMDGSIQRVDEAGVVHPFAPAREGWLQMGMLIDEPRGLLWACAVQEEGLLGEVQSYRLTDGVVQHTFDLTELNVIATCNDLDLADNGHLFVSDRENPYLYRLQPDRNIGVTVATSELLNGLLGSNGVAMTPDQRAVIVGNYAPARLAVVYLDAPNEPIEMTFDGGPFRDGLTGGADGIFWHGDALYISFPGKLFRAVPHGTDWTHSTLWEIPLAGGVSDVQPIGDTLYVGNGQPVAYVTESTPDPFTITPVAWSAWERND